MSQANISVVEAGSFELPTLTIGDFQQLLAANSPSTVHDAACRLYAIQKGLESIYGGFQRAEDIAQTSAEKAMFGRLRGQVDALSYLTRMPLQGAQS